MLSLIFPEIEIEAWNRQGLMSDADRVAHHEKSQLYAIDQTDGRPTSAFSRSTRTLSEAAGCNENPLGRTAPVYSCEETVHLLATDSSIAVIPFRLNADLAQAELVERDNPVDALIARVWGVADEGIRRRAVRRFPYHLIYLELPDRLQILAVAHDRRRPGYWVGRVPP